MIGDKDQDGFYWGELRGRRGFVPHNMVTEVDENQIGTQAAGTGAGVPAIPGSTAPTAGGKQYKNDSKTDLIIEKQNAIKEISLITGTTGSGVQQSVRNVSRERWGDIYCNMPVKRMIALYDYDPQELSPNVDAEVCDCSLNCFKFTSFIENVTIEVKWNDMYTNLI